VTGEGLPPGEAFDLAWSTVTGSWKVTTAEYFGRAFTPVAYRIATVKSDANGRFTATFAASDDFGFLHDIVLQQGDRLLTQNAFNVDMTAKLLSDRGPPGSPIEIEVHGERDHPGEDLPAFHFAFEVMPDPPEGISE
jgi:hypothetical protein